MTRSRIGAGSGTSDGEVAARAAASDRVHRRPRADAVRNRQRLVEAAIEALAAHGLDVGVAEVARRAGVGPGTLFRHFPTKEDLILAVFEVRVAEAIATAHRALEFDDAGEGFEWFHFQLAEMQLRDIGFFHAIRQRIFEHPGMRKRKDEIEALIAEILARAQRAGAVRPDVTIDDLRFLMMSLTQADYDLPGEQANAPARYLRILLDGLKPAGASDLAAIGYESVFAVGSRVTRR